MNKVHVGIIVFIAFAGVAFSFGRTDKVKEEFSRKLEILKEYKEISAQESMYKQEQTRLKKVKEQYQSKFFLVKEGESPTQILADKLNLILNEFPDIKIVSYKPGQILELKQGYLKAEVKIILSASINDFTKFFCRVENEDTFRVEGLQILNKGDKNLEFALSTYIVFESKKGKVKKHAKK